MKLGGNKAKTYTAFQVLEHLQNWHLTSNLGLTDPVQGTKASPYPEICRNLNNDALHTSTLPNPSTQSSISEKNMTIDTNLGKTSAPYLNFCALWGLISLLSNYLIIFFQSERFSACLTCSPSPEQHKPMHVSQSEKIYPKLHARSQFYSQICFILLLSLLLHTHLATTKNIGSLKTAYKFSKLTF